MAVDPVCKMKVDPETAPAKSEYKGKTYYFCAPGCKVAFRQPALQDNLLTIIERRFFDG